MLLNSVVIVLREVLEAALMLSVMLAASRHLGIQARWVVIALALGLFGAAGYGYSMGFVSNLFDGVGQEVFNALLQYILFFALAIIIFLFASCNADSKHHGVILPVLMATAMTVAITREGSEILVYLSGFLQLREFVSSVGVGSFIGACIGISVGVLLYYLLLSQPARRAIPIAAILLSLTGAGMVLQATGLLIQADWISVAGPLWNTSGFLPEDSLPGQLLYALIGYEASPSAKEVLFYSASLVAMALALFAGRAARADNEAHTE